MKKIDYSLPMKQVYTKALPSTLLLLAGGAVLYQLLWHNLFLSFNSIWLRFYVFIPIIVLLTIFHEALHLLGFWLLGKAGRQHWHIGIKSATPYAHCSKPLRLRAYRVATALPGILLGIFPLLIAFAWGWPLVFVYAIVMTAGALGDLFILLNVRKLPATSLVADHPSRPGCWLLIP